jgi:CheY-like chemotaxis protein
VDDSILICKLFYDVLELEGHKIVGEAHNGVECIEKINNSSKVPDFILMDHQMPLKNGLETTEELLKINPYLKIIFLSADNTVRKKALKSGAVKFIEKPFSIHTLFNSINGL